MAPVPSAEADNGGPVFVIRVDSIIHPVAASFVEQSLERAAEEGGTALIIELDTPGGAMISMMDITTSILEAETPVVVYVFPSGAQASSAGFFILMASDIAAMAPGTNTGAAHPVAGGGQDIPGAMGEKVEQSAAANIRSLAERSGRNVELAEEAVMKSRSFSADEALQNGLVEIVSPSLTDLLEEISGRTVVKADGREVVLETDQAEVRRIEMTPLQRFRSVLVHPEIAYILLGLGFLGLYVEITNPGLIFPGVFGAISLILAFYALSVLPVNYAGVALIILAAVLFVAEIQITSYGLLTIAGIVSLVLGSVMLFEDLDPAARLSGQFIAGVVGLMVVVILLLMSLVVRAHRHRIHTGAEGMVNERGISRSAIDPRGKVTIHGEIWNAVADVPVAAGKPVEVVGVDGMTVRVRPLADPREATDETSEAS